MPTNLAGRNCFPLLRLIVMLTVSPSLVGVAFAQSGKAFVWITSSPKGAMITLDGVKTNLTTPARFDSVAVGMHTVDLKREYCFDYTGQFEIHPNDSVFVFHASLQRPSYQTSNQHWALSITSVVWKPGTSLFVGFDRQLNRISQQVDNALIIKLVMGDRSSSPFSIIGFPYFSIDDSFYGRREPQYSLDPYFIQLDTLRQFEAAMISLVFLVPNLQGRAFILRYTDNFGEMTLPYYEYNLVADVHNARLPIPTSPYLSQNYPNPFNPSTTIRYGIPSRAHVSIRIFNLLGQLVSELVDDMRPPGEYSVAWNATALPSGIYYCCLMVNDFRTTRKLLLTK